MIESTLSAVATVSPSTRFEYLAAMAVGAKKAAAATFIAFSLATAVAGLTAGGGKLAGAGCAGALTTIFTGIACAVGVNRRPLTNIPKAEEQGLVVPLIVGLAVSSSILAYSA